MSRPPPISPLSPSTTLSLSQHAPHHPRGEVSRTKREKKNREPHPKERVRHAGLEDQPVVRRREHEPLEWCPFADAEHAQQHAYSPHRRRPDEDPPAAFGCEHDQRRDGELRPVELQTKQRAGGRGVTQ